MAALTTPTWTMDTKTFKIARLGDLQVHLVRARADFGTGDRRNGYIWTAEVLDSAKATVSTKRVVTGKRDALAMLVKAAG